MARTKQTMMKRRGTAPRKNLSTVRKITAATTTKRRRFLPGTQALREIRRYQKGGELLLLKTPFSRVVREVAQDLHLEKNYPHVKFKKAAIGALHHAAEAWLVGLFGDSQDYALHAGREMILDIDLRLAHKKRTKTMEQRVLDAETQAIFKRPYRNPNLPKRRRRKPPIEASARVPKKPTAKAIKAQKKKKKLPVPEKVVSGSPVDSPTGDEEDVPPEDETEDVPPSSSDEEAEQPATPVPPAEE